VAACFLAIIRHQRLEFGLGVFMLQMSRPCPAEHSREFRPGIGAAHIDDAYRLDARLWWFDAE
jgi:hypothetical protein